ncbi:MAG: guanylate kinase [Alphaproteobacteria bacterium]|jgi:guanylate kinase|nr:guanylate kinase [Alphaproteobacteria bacterium]MDP6517453.1 guanylate kinase [Alphaproteobacteria bacterium]
MLVLSSPSGAGKTSISRRLLDQDSNLWMSVSATTRPKRIGETEGVDYLFVDLARFDAMVRGGELLEHAQVFDHHYGTPRERVARALDEGRDVLFDIDWQGAQQITEAAAADVVKVFILPPSTEELEHRLKSRAQDSDAVVAKRMSRAAAEMTHWAEYDYVIVNSDLDGAVGDVTIILRAERLRRHRQLGISNFVDQLVND